MKKLAAIGLIPVGIMMTLLAMPLIAVITLAGVGAGAAVECGAISGEDGRILATIRTMESGGDYTITASTSTAAGAYQFLTSTWQSVGAAAGIDTAEYPTADVAPPNIQDHVALYHLNWIREHYNHELITVPTIWYIGHLPDTDEEWNTPPPYPGNPLSPRQYATKWLETYYSLQGDGTSGCASTSPGAGDTINANGFTWSMVTPPAVFNYDQLDDPHHDYPAWDLMIPEGTPVYALTDGQIYRIVNWPHNWWSKGCKTGDDECESCGVGVSIRRSDGFRHIYCHFSTLGPVTDNQQIKAGTLLGYSGNTGRSGAPHLHLELRSNDQQWCPQPIVTAIYQLQPIPTDLTADGCSF